MKLSEIKGYGKVKPFTSSSAYQKETPNTCNIKLPVRHYPADNKKLQSSLVKAIEACSPHDGMVISFHHHLRNGDYVVLSVVKELAKMGIKNIHLAPSSLTDAHNDLIPFIKDGTITKIWTSGVRSKLGMALSEGALADPIVIQSHGNRARSIVTGELQIDVAFVAASAADEQGNCTGTIGPNAFGSLGYSMVDAQYAKKTIVITDNLVPFPCSPISIPQAHVDYVVKIDKIGDSEKIASGATRITTNPTDLLLAKFVANVIAASGYMVPGFNFQLGSGGAALATAKFIRPYLKDQKIKGGFLLGGIVHEAVNLKEEGFFSSIFDVQSFDNTVSDSLRNDPLHYEISADSYANPLNAGCITNLVDICILSALQIDTSFNVNVITGSDGVLMGASGGHSDTAYGAGLTIIVCPSFRGRLPTIVNKVTTIVTPGECVDVLVTERGICVNPKRKELAKILTKAGIKVIDIQDLKAKVDKLMGEPKPLDLLDKVVGVVQYRDGSVIDIIYQPKLHALNEK